jgi:hypothetical protein
MATARRPLILACATDAGGARSLAPVIAAARGRAEVVVLAGPTTRPLFAEHGIAVTAEAPQPLDEAVEALLERLRPDAVLCGRTFAVSADRLLLRAARARGVWSVLVQDEWYNYRYSLLDAAGAMTCLPHRLCCPDALAVAEALAEGVPADIPVATGSPALARLVDHLDTLDPPRPAILDGLPAAPVVTFLSETHSLDAARGEPSAPLFAGYDEIAVRQALGRVVQRMGRPVTVIEKLHPSDPRADWANPATAPVLWRTSREAPLWPLLWHSDAVIGIVSMALLEAALIGRPVASFQPDGIPERCTAVRQGLVPRLADEAAVGTWLEGALGGQRMRPRPARPRFAAADAASVVLDVVLNGEERSRHGVVT